MIRSLWRYGKAEAYPRTRSILSGSEFWISLGIGFCLGKWGELVLPKTTKVGEVCVSLLTYAAIALGFCLAGLTLVLTFPHERLMTRLATTKPPKAKDDAYSALLFVFTWTSLAHWILIVLSILVLLFVGSDRELVLAGSIFNRVLAGIVSALTAYCLCQFLITLFTLSQVGTLHIKALQEEDRKTRSGKSLAADRLH